MSVIVSIIIPCYNQEKYIAKCLDSILAQTFTDYEVIVVNDGSTDDSLAIIKKYADKFNNFILIDQKNAGQSIARNNALLKATGKYVCFIDSDDFIDETYVADLLQAAVSNDADIAMCPTRHIAGEDVKLVLPGNTILENITDKIRALPHGGVWDKIYRMDFLKKHQLVFPAGLYWEDNLFSIQCCYFSNKIVLNDGGAYNYICNPNSTVHSSKNEERKRNDGLTIAQLIMDFLDKINATPDERAAVIDFCLSNFIWKSNLLVPGYWKKLNNIIHPMPAYFKKVYRKLRFKHFKRKIKGFILRKAY